MNTVTKVRLTTAVKTNASLYKQVEDAFDMLKSNLNIKDICIVERKKLTITQLFAVDQSPVIVFLSNGPKLYFSPRVPIYFHLDTTKVKINMQKENNQPILIDMINHIQHPQQSFHFVDGTMGFGRDSYLVLNSFPNVVVYSIEQNPLIHFVISEGMKRALTEDVLKRIYFINDDYNHWIKRNSEKVNILYLDHMFEETMNPDDRMGELSKHINSNKCMDLSNSYETLILKAHYKSPLFKQFNVFQCIRKSSKTHYGLRRNKRKNSSLI